MNKELPNWQDNSQDLWYDTIIQKVTPNAQTVDESRNLIGREHFRVITQEVEFSWRWSLHIMIKDNMVLHLIPFWAPTNLPKKSNTHFWTGYRSHNSITAAKPIRAKHEFWKIRLFEWIPDIFGPIIREVEFTRTYGRMIENIEYLHFMLFPDKSKDSFFPKWVLQKNRLCLLNLRIPNFMLKSRKI